MRAKKRNKKILSLLIATLMIISMLPSSVFAATDDVMIEEYADVVTEEADVVDGVADEAAEVPDVAEQEVEADLAGASEIVSATAEGLLSGGKMTFDAVLDGVSVSAAVPASRAPQGSVMTVDLVDVADYADAIAAKIYGKDVSALKGLELHFYNKKGKEITHINTSDVTITADAMDADSYALCRLNGNSVGVVKKADASAFTFKEKKAYTYAIVGLVDDGVLRATAETGSNGVKSFNLDNIEVIAPKDAFGDDVAMEASDVTGDAATEEEALVGSSEDEVIVAYEISFYDEDGVEQQPEKEVTVKIATALDMSKNYKLIHIADNGETNEVENAVFTESGVEFVADSFSVYAVVWNDASGTERSATITWGYMNGSQFTELEEGSTVQLDTTASTVSLENSYEGYYMIGATYKASGSSDWVDVSPARLTRIDNGWQITTVTHNDDETTTTNTVQIADGSEIHVIYGPVTTPSQSGAADPNVPSPVTEKNVTDNGDGTYTITLDTTATQVQETDSVGANVLVIFDRTQSMSNRMGTSTRLQVAKDAVAKLVETLDCDTNDIQLAFVPFASTGTQVQVGGELWTSDGDTFVSTVNDTGQQSGTNWESGLYYGRQTLNSRDSDATYVIFLTDGEPNRRGTTSSQNANTNTAISYALTQAQAITALDNVYLYGIFCGSDSGYNNLANMITNAGGVETINGTNEQDIEDAFENIAHTIVENLGASNAAVDDGVPSLAGISANVTGEAGGYEYYKKDPGESDFTEWDNAPGAIYSNDNGVTWDLSSVGTLPAGTTYRIKFTVWPSQAAYDLIADLNNGLKDYDDLSDKEKAAVTGSKEAGYTLVTNTHLNTTYTFKNQNYSDAPDDLQYAAMPLPTKTISVKKNWPRNALDDYGAATYRDENGEEQTATEITLNLQKDHADYLPVTVTAEDGWTNDNVYVSCGNMTVKNGVVTIHEPGHDYKIVEPEAFSYYWDLISDVYHPMVINGTATLLVLDEKATAADNENSFEINGKIYVKHADSDNILSASNYRRSNLNLTKEVSTNGAPDKYFTYKVTVEDANSTDGNVWFSAWNPESASTVTDIEWVIDGATAESENTGYWYAENGSTVTLKIKAGWNVRFLNLYHGSTFSFEETDMPEFFELDSVEAEASEDFMDEDIEDADWYEITDKKVEGTIIEPNNSYTVTYTNKYEAFYVYHSGVPIDGNLEVIGMPASGKYDLTQNITSNTLYGGYYLDYAGKGDYKDDGIKGTTGIAYTGMNCDWSGAQTVDGKAMTPVAGVTYYIKEVPTYYLRNYYQINYMKAAPNELKALYLISAIDDTNYKETGFILKNEDSKKAVVATQMQFKNSATNKIVTLKADTIFKKVDGENAITDPGEYLTYFDASNTSYFAAGTFTVLPYWITPDGITVNGISTRTVTITELTKSGISKIDEKNS